MSRLLAAGIVASAIGLATAGCASSGYYAYQRDPGYQRRAYDNGFREGIRDGEKDARNHRSFSLERHDEWRDADEGYHRDFGDRDRYRRDFRDGFRAGYTQGFERFAPRGQVYGEAYGGVQAGPTVPYYSGQTGAPLPPVTPAYHSPAADIGYRDGYDAGRHDGRDHDPYDPQRSGRYRSADHDYDHRFGPKDEYKREYRAGFERGYAAGFREFR